MARDQSMLLLWKEYITRREGITNLAKKTYPRKQSSCGQHVAHMGSVGPRWAPCLPQRAVLSGTVLTSLRECICFVWHWITKCINSSCKSPEQSRTRLQLCTNKILWYLIQDSPRSNVWLHFCLNYIDTFQMIQSPKHRELQKCLFLTFCWVSTS